MKIYSIKFSYYTDYNMFEGEWESRESDLLFKTKERAVEYLIGDGYILNNEQKLEYRKGADDYATIITKTLVE